MINSCEFQAQEHKGDVEKAVTQIKANLATAATKLEEAIGPDGVKKAKELKANLDEGLNKAIAEAERLAKAAEPEATSKWNTVSCLVSRLKTQWINDIYLFTEVKGDLTDLAKKLLDEVADLGKKLKTELDKNLAKA